MKTYPNTCPSPYQYPFQRYQIVNSATTAPSSETPLAVIFHYARYNLVHVQTLAFVDFFRFIIYNYESYFQCGPFTECLFVPPPDSWWSSMEWGSRNTSKLFYYFVRIRDLRWKLNVYNNYTFPMLGLILFVLIWFVNFAKSTNRYTCYSLLL